MIYGVGETYHYGFGTYNGSNALTDADSLPAGVLVVNGTDSAAAVTIARAATGRYTIAADLAGRAVGDDCFVRFSAAVGGVTQEGRTPPFRVAFPAALTGGVLTRGTGSAQLNVSGGKAPATIASGDNSDKAGYSLTQGFPANFAALAVTSGGLVSLNLAQAGLSPRALDSVADASLTVGDALVAALCGAAGKESVSGTTYLVKTPSTGTVIRSFTLDSASTPTARS